jgi:predicted flavoprotein YhiN
MLSRSVITQLCRLTDIDTSLKAASLSKKNRIRLVSVIKSLPLTVVSTKPIEQATVTRGGVCIEEIDPVSMESKKCPGLYFAGEVMDVDGPCGGFNLQIAFSTAVAAAKNISIVK